MTLASIGDGVITTDLQGRVRFMNGVAEALTGWSAADAMGASLDTVFRIVNEETREFAENPAHRALREGVIIGLANHTLLIARDGVERPLDDSAAPIRDPKGAVSGVVLVFRDVTQRREAERALRQSEERFRLLVEGVIDYAIFMLDAEGRVMSWNLGAERIKGYRASEIIGSHFSRFYPQEAIDSGFPAKELQVARKVGRFEDEGWRIRKDGSKFWANVVITAMHDDAGMLKGFSKVTRDLTQRRQLERARAQADALSETNRRKDEFLAMLSHELRNPLAPLLNAVDLLKLDAGNPAARQSSIDVIERQARNLTSLINDLLEVSRITTGMVRLRREVVDARGIVQRALDTVRPLIDERELALSVALPAEPLLLDADATRLEQVAVNLLINAAKYSDLHGTVRVRLEQDGPEAVLRVADNGTGIEAELLPQVFDAFTQGERSLDRSLGGLGVGLTVVRRIVELHGGKVEAHSAGKGQGSEFVVRLPVAQGALHAVPPTGETPVAGAVRRLRVLVVDDSRDASDALARLVEFIGHDVRSTCSSRDALEIATTFRPDLYLLDIGLPEMDGYELARCIRNRAELKDARLIAVSGYGQASDHERSRGAGFDAHLVKPVVLEKLQEVLAPLSRGSCTS